MAPKAIMIGHYTTGLHSLRSLTFCYEGYVVT